LSLSAACQIAELRLGLDGSKIHPHTIRPSGQPKKMLHAKRFDAETVLQVCPEGNNINKQ